MRNVRMTKCMHRLLVAFLPAAHRLLACFVATAAVTAAIAQVEAEREQELGEVTVQSRLKGVVLTDDMQRRETITSTGLAKMACCTVAESFENSASVTVGYSDAVTGTRQIRLLGLGGCYTQTLDESRPILRGLGSPYAMDHTPGQWLNSVQVAKGASAVTAGHDAITGQINLEHRKPTDQERLFLNFYLDDMLRPELNASSALPLRSDGNLSTILLVHGAADTEWREMGAMDLNKDGFRDLPRQRGYSLANKWLWIEPRTGLQMRWGMKYTRDDRLGGSIHATDADRERKLMLSEPTPFHYASNISIESLNAYLKTALPFGPERTSATGDVQRSSIAFVADYDHWGEGAFFGRNSYVGLENTLALSLLTNHYLGGAHALAYGVQARLAHVRDNALCPVSSDRWTMGSDEREVGAYAEYTLTPSQRFTAVMGVRGDYSHLYGKAYVTPRMHLKWKVLSATTLRASVGWGYRTPQVVAEHVGLMASGQRLAVDGASLRKPERAMTTGASLTQTLWLFGHPATLALDYFYTRFAYNVVADWESNPATAALYGSDRLAYSHTWQADLSATVAKGLDVYAAFRYNDTKQTFHTPSGFVRRERPLTDRYKGLLNVQCYTNLRRWVFDATAQLNGPARIPLEGLSPAYMQLYAQVTHKMGLVELYAGCENILDYRQKNPIRYAEEPFSERFNTLNVWGPLMGRKFYVGLRFRMY